MTIECVLQNNYWMGLSVSIETNLNRLLVVSLVLTMGRSLSLNDGHQRIANMRL